MLGVACCRISASGTEGKGVVLCYLCIMSIILHLPVDVCD